jgi:RNA polymerase sigma-70 factor (ECF subfamily)
VGSHEAGLAAGKADRSNSSKILEELIRRFSERLYNLAVRYTDNPGEAEEIVQEVFLRAYQYLPRLDLREPVEFWLFRVAVNLCRDRARKKWEFSFSDVSPDGDLDLAAEDRMSTEEDVEWRESKAALRKAVNGLSESERVVITLRYNEGFSYDQIAKILEVPVSTIGTYLFRAKKNLYRALVQPSGEEQ